MKALPVAVLLAVGALAAQQSGPRVRVRAPEPLVVSLDGREPRFTAAADGVALDLDGDGLVERRAWLAPDANAGVVVIDENGNGRIDGAWEIPGSGRSGPPNGFQYLLALDGFMNDEDAGTGRRTGVPNGRLDRDDWLFAHLLVWTDLNRNGVSEEAELQSLGYAGYQSIDLNPQPIALDDGKGNLIVSRSTGVHGEPASQQVWPVVTVRLAAQSR